MTKILEGKEVGRRKRSVEWDPGHGRLCSQAEENLQEESRQTSPLPQNFYFSPGRKGPKFVTVSLDTSQSVSAVVVRVSWRAKSSAMGFEMKSSSPEVYVYNTHKHIPDTYFYVTLDSVAIETITG